MQESLIGLASENETSRIKETIFLAGTKGIEASQLPPLLGCKPKLIQRELQSLSSQGEIIGINPEKRKYLHSYHCKRLAGFFVKTLERFHLKFPEKPGAIGSDFYGKMSKMFTPQEIAVLLNWTVRQKLLEQNEGHFHIPGFQGGLNKKQKEQKSAIVKLLQQKGFQPPSIVNLAKELSLEQGEIEKLLKIGLAEKWVVRVKDDLWYHPEAVEKAKIKLIDHCSENKTLTVVEFKDLLAVSRKHAIGLLEYFDSMHLTRRIENHRILRLDIALK